MGYYCTVPQCTSLAGKTKNVKFHRFPRDVNMADKWNIILKRGKPYTKYSKVCSLHFTQSDYNVTTMGQWKTLSKDAVPSQNLPRVDADGKVMVIRKSRTVKYRETRRDSQGEKGDKWANSMIHAPLPSSALTTPDHHEDPNAAYRLQTLSAIASALPPQLPNQPSMKPKKQDAFMQTDPIASEDDDLSQPNNSYSETSDNSFNSEQLDYQKDYLNQQYKEKDYSSYQKEKDYVQYKDDKYQDKKYDDPKDYIPKTQDYTPKSQDYTQKSQDYTPKPQDYTPKPQDYTPKSQDYTPKSQDYTPKPQDYTPKQQDYTPKSQDYTPKPQDYTPKPQHFTPKAQDYTKQEDYIPQTNEEYNKEAEKYALERKSLNGYEKLPMDYQKQDYQKQDYQKHDYQKVALENGYQMVPEYMGYSYPDSVEILRNQQHNLEMLQQQHRINENQNFFNENHIKQEVDMNSEEEKFMYERAKDQLDGSALYGGHRGVSSIEQQQRLLEHLQQQVKQEPDSAGCESVLQPQGSPYYAPNGHTNSTAGYYEQRPGPELLIAKQNALAAHTQLWQNTMKRPFFYSETPPHYPALHRYEDLTRILQ